MNDRLQNNLVRARAQLLEAQRVLASSRRCGFLVQVSEKLFLQCLDRAWEAQCMADPWGTR